RAQHTFVATATRNGRTLIVVVMGAVDAGYVEAKSLLDAGFATSPATSTGPTLPPPAVSLYSTRASDRDAFAKLGTAPVAAAGAVTPASVASDVPASIQLAQPPRAAAPVVTASTTRHHASIFSLRNALIVLILLGLTALFMRRRAVKRQRIRRLGPPNQRPPAVRRRG